MNKVNISHINNRHNDWLRAIVFYKQEVEMLKTRLTEVAGKNTNADMLREVEHFENQLKIQSDQLDHLAHDIRAMITELAQQAAEAKAGYVEGSLLTRHNELEESYVRAEDIVNKLRRGLNKFVARWL
jgi:hypothetical protein